MRQIREVCALSAPKAHDVAELLLGAPKAPVICSHFVKYAEHIMLPHFVKYVESQSRSDLFSILLNILRHSREATVTPRRRGEAASII